MADPMRIRAQVAGDKATVRVLMAQWGPSVAKNPFLQFNLKGAKAGDKIGIAWTDNKGDKRSDETIVS